MKFLAWGLIVLTVLFTIQAMGQQISGRADVSAGRSFQRHEADRDREPEEFQNLMSYQWIRAFLPGTAGIFLLYMIRRGDRLDPFSPHFQGGAEIDRLSDYLDEEEHKRQGCDAKD